MSWGHTSWSKQGDDVAVVTAARGPGAQYQAVHPHGGATRAGRDRAHAAPQPRHASAASASWNRPANRRRPHASGRTRDTGDGLVSWLKREKQTSTLEATPGEKRILFPFDAHGLAPSALDAALRLAKSQSGTLVPVFLARVPLHLSLDAALPRQSQLAVPMQDAVEQRASQFDVPVDSRIERGRSYRRRSAPDDRQRRRFRHDRAGSGGRSGAWIQRGRRGLVAGERPRGDRRAAAGAGPCPDTWVTWRA